MDRNLIENWLDKQIEHWYAGRFIRTLSQSCGNEYATNLNCNSYKEIHLSGGRIFEIAEKLRSVVTREDFGDGKEKVSFYYMDFQVFELFDKEEH